jgi:hypothetical protein
MNINFKQLKVGEVLSETSFYTVEKIVAGQVQLATESGESVVLDKGYTESFLKSASQANNTKVISKTELAALFLANANVAMSLSFNKQVKEEDVLAELISTHENSAPKDVKKKFQETLKKSLKGEERIIEGRHHGNQDDFGRVQFIDMKVAKDKTKSYDTRNRLVDPRGINWLIVGNTKYVVK